MTNEEIFRVMLDMASHESRLPKAAKWEREDPVDVARPLRHSSCS